MKVVRRVLIYCFICIGAFSLSFVLAGSISKTVTVNHIMEMNEKEYKSLPKIVKQVPSEKIDMWIDIPTYDKSGQVTHPQVLYFEEGMNGYKYWMVSTPYPGNDAYLENPSIVVSNDGINWIEPDGIKNPISGYPTKVRDDSYYSDPFMLYDGKRFELFFRKTKSILNGKVIVNGYNYIYTQTSTDGINWTKPKMILDNNPPERYMSISVIKENDLYKLWYVNYDGKVRYIESKDLKKFTKPITVDFDDFNKKVWHGEVQYIDNKYVSVFMIKYVLYYTESVDGKKWEKPMQIDTKIESVKHTYNHIYKSSFIIGDDYVELFVPYGVNHIWKLHYTKILKEEFFNKIYE